MRDLTEYVVDANPVYQVGLVTERVSGHHRGTRDLRGLSYYWEGAGRGDLAETTVYLLAYAGAYLALGALFAWRAKCRLRRRIF